MKPTHKHWLLEFINKPIVAYILGWVMGAFTMWDMK